MRDITVSIVSHRQNALVNDLLEDVRRVCADRIALVLTQNAPDSVPLATGDLTCPVEVISNTSVKGFGANHNTAFRHCQTPYFCVLNPDIRLRTDPFAPLLASLEGDHAGVAGPLVRNPAGKVEDSARRFPTAGILVRKALGARPGPDYPPNQGAQDVDWIGGMCMLFRSDTYRLVGGFDEAYFLYYEDVDLCRRLRAAGKSVTYQPAAEVIHDARRASRRNPRLAMHHLTSALRFLLRR
ncbi:MAG: glycosyltransferase family 2 protein [Betaproteobacteria bacterium]